MEIYRITFYDKKGSMHFGTAVHIEPELNMRDHVDAVEMNLRTDPTIYIGLGYLRDEDKYNPNLFFYLCNMDIVNKIGLTGNKYKDHLLIEIRNLVRLKNLDELISDDSTDEISEIRRIASTRKMSKNGQ